MASGLPVIVTDWNGYRDTVLHGETGFLVPTWTPPNGAGSVIAEAIEDGRASDDVLHGLTSLMTSFDIGACAKAVQALATQPALRQRMANSARRHSRAYDWGTVLGRYRTLWEELAALRATASPHPARAASHPLRQDPFRVFAGYPTWRIGPYTWLRLSPACNADRTMVAELRAAVFLAPALSFDAMAQAILAGLEAGPSTAENLRVAIRAADHAHFYRMLAWLTKFGLVLAEPRA
jgi:hypothetical protein